MIILEVAAFGRSRRYTALWFGAWVLKSLDQATYVAMALSHHRRLDNILLHGRSGLEECGLKCKALSIGIRLTDCRNAVNL